MAQPQTDIAPDTTSQSSSQRWRPGLDGLRALAVLGVMAYHEPNVEMPGGFLGVDLFFVLSGFLITGLLLDERRTSGTLSLRSFWNRRARRLLPALAALLLAVVVATTILGDVSQRRDLPGGVLSAVLYDSNWNQIAQHQSYFDQFTSLSPLQHLWSLAIEEQFYIVWPLVVIACLRRSRRLLIAVTSVATVASISLMAFFLGSGDPSRSYYGTDTRAFTMLIGALGAIFAWHLRPSGRKAFSASVLGLGALSASFLFIHDDARWMYRGGFVLFAVLALGLIILASGNNVVSKAMSHPILRKIGFLSYALYLWHWPIRGFATDTRLRLPDTGVGTVAGIAVRLALTFAAAWLSMELIERWFRRSTLGVARFGIAWVVIGSILVASAFIAAPSIGSTIATNFGGDQAAQRERNLQLKGDSTLPTLMIVGDSVAITLDNGIRIVTDRKVSVVGGAELGCALLTSPKVMTFTGKWEPTGSTCPDHNDYWSKLIAHHHPDVVVMLMGAWDLYARDWGNGAVAPGDPEFDQHYRQAMNDSLETLSATGAEIIVLTTPCFEPLAGEKSGPQYDIERVERIAQLQRESVETFNTSNQSAPASIVDLQSITCDNGFTQTRDGIAWRPDGVHFSIEGSQVAARWLLDSLPTSARSRLGLPTN
ncbi:MAG: acyltransferase family protein [Actinobacteria bacterium]|nr:acyltransferase family protein [Actinomycetota bacterium]